MKEKTCHFLCIVFRMISLVPMLTKRGEMFAQRVILYTIVSGGVFITM